jgi:uncharacterized membrane protein YfcA
MVNTAVAAIAQITAAHRRRLSLWVILVGTVCVWLSAQSLWPDWPLPPALLADEPPLALLTVFMLALACEYIDSSLGMGYGTTLTPLLLIAGFDPMQIVPAVLFSELLSGVAAAALHHHDGNVDWVRDQRLRRTALLLILLSTLGAVTAVLVAVSIPRFWLSLSIIAIVIAMGILVLATWRRRIPYRPGAIVTIGVVAAFNKGLSGGGYGPLVTAGQVVSGVPAKQAVAVTSLAEAFTCLIALLAFLALGNRLDWSLALPLAIGALLSVPVATITIKGLKESTIRAAIGGLTLGLGLLSLGKLLL